MTSVMPLVPVGSGIDDQSSLPLAVQLVIAFAIVSMIVAVVALVVIGIAREITARRALRGRTAER